MPSFSHVSVLEVRQVVTSLQNQPASSTCSTSETPLSLSKCLLVSLTLSALTTFTSAIAVIQSSDNQPPVSCICARTLPFCRLGHYKLLMQMREDTTTLHVWVRLDPLVGSWRSHPPQRHLLCWALSALRTPMALVCSASVALSTCTHA